MRTIYKSFQQWTLFAEEIIVDSITVSLNKFIYQMKNEIIYNEWRMMKNEINLILEWLLHQDFCFWQILTSTNEVEEHTPQSVRGRKGCAALYKEGSLFISDILWLLLHAGRPLSVMRKSNQIK